MHDFNINDLDELMLTEQVMKNVKSISESAAARKGRSKQQILDAVSVGIPCEVYMMQFQDCENYEHKYGDVISEDGTKIECKASTYPWTDQKMKQMRDKIKHYSPADVIMFWHKDGDDYKYYKSIEMEG